MFPHQAGRVLLNGANVADPHHGSRHKQQNDQAEAGDQDPEDVLMSDLPRKHAVISIAREEPGPEYYSYRYALMWDRISFHGCCHPAGATPDG